MKRNGFVAEDIVARFDVWRYDDIPGVIISNHDIASPGTRIKIWCSIALSISNYLSGVDEADLVDFEELQRRLVDSLARSLAVSKIRSHGPVVSDRPIVPLHSNCLTSVNRDGNMPGGGILVADHIVGLE
jgi:hypothetical protein